MTEAFIRAKAIKELEVEGYATWWPYPPRNQYCKEKDIFAVFDLIAVRKYGGAVRHSTESGKTLRWIQYTSDNGGAMAARRAKIIHTLRTKQIFPPGSKEVWGYKKDKHVFRKVEITYQDVFPK